MPVFEYQAKNLQGRLMKGEYSGDAIEEIEDSLRTKGFFIVSHKVKHPVTSVRFWKRKIRAQIMAVLCRQLAVLLSAGVTIVESISIIKGQMEDRRLDTALEDIYRRLQQGELLSEAIMRQDGCFEELFINMIKVGEVSGTIEEIMVQLADYYENDNKIRQKIKSAITYPIILVVLTALVIALLMIKVLPMFSDILTQMGGEMPALTKGLMAINHFFISNFFIIMGLVVLVVVGVHYFGKSPVGAFWLDLVKLRTPGVGNVKRKMITARFARIMSILLKSGIPIIPAMDIIKRMIGSRVVEKKFENCSEKIKEGEGISAPIQEMGFFPALLVHMIIIGENSGALDEMLGRTASFFDAEAEEALKRMTVLIEPALIIILGVMVGLIIVSMMLPMIGIMTAV